jgi:hypothetical protein
MLRLEHHRGGPRVFFLGLRVHHGPVCLLVALLALTGAWHDRRDFPWWP